MTTDEGRSSKLSLSEGEKIGKYRKLTANVIQTGLRGSLILKTIKYISSFDQIAQ